MTIAIRAETSADHAAIRHVHRLAFGQEDEGQLVDALREGGDVRASLVAEQVGQIAGHILVSDLPIVTKAGTVSALALAPLAVLPEFQKCGIGSTLVRQGLAVCREHGHKIVVVLGDPQFYRRFGFSAELAAHLDCPFSEREAFMALELAQGALAGVTGRVVYAPAFGLLAEGH